MRIRLLHPQHLDGIWLGLTPCRLPFDILSEYLKPCSWKKKSEIERELSSFSVLKKTESQVLGGNCVKSPSFWTLFFLQIRILKMASSFSLISWNFSGPGFWILTKGVKRQPVPVHMNARGVVYVEEVGVLRDFKV